MGKIKLNERQVLMLKNLEQSKSKGKVLKITESQYNKLFKDKGKAVKNLEKSIEKSGMVGENSKKIDLVDFAQEIIVFIKDVLSNNDHRLIPFSSYWSDMGLTKNQLFKLIKKHNLLNLVDESEMREYTAPKHGFRKNIKELHNTITEWGNSDGGYPAGANNDPNAPWNTPDDPDDPEEPYEKIITVPDEQKKFKLIYMGEDGMSVFKAGNELYVASIGDIHTDEINGDPEVIDNTVYYYDYEGGAEDGITPKGFEDYINDAYNQGKIKPVRNDKTTNFPVPTLATPAVKSKILKYYGDDPKMVQALKQLPETTTAASSGSYVGGGSFDGPIKKGMSNSPSDEMGGLINDNTFGSDHVVPYLKDYSDEEYFEFNNEKWKYVWGDYNGRPDLAVYRKNTDMTYDYSWFRKEVLGINEADIDETTSTATVGAGVGANGQGTQTNPQYAYDAPAGDGSAFWNAGNKQNKKMKGNNMPIVKGGKITEDEKDRAELYTRKLQQWKSAQFLPKSDPYRKKLRNELIKVSKSLGIDLQLKEGKLYLKKSDLKKLLETDNMSKTAYPDGEMISFDDCTKLNNNKVAQNGGCSQGDTGVVKTKKTKGSVVSENFNPQVGGGTYAVQIIKKGNLVILEQNNGQHVVVHVDYIPDLINTLKSVY